MYVYIYVCVCLCVYYIYICIYICLYVYVYEWVYVCTCMMLNNGLRPLCGLTISSLARRLAFTRYSFAPKLYCGSPSLLYLPPNLQSLPYYNTSARPLRNIRPLTDLLLDAVNHTILVIAISCKGQLAGTRASRELHTWRIDIDRYRHRYIDI